MAGQALRAATLSVEPGYLANSVHCYFLRRGRPDLPLDCHVERVRTGRTYASRTWTCARTARTIFTMLASFHVDEPGQEYDHPMPADVPDPTPWRGPTVTTAGRPSSTCGRWPVGSRWCGGGGG